MRGCPYQWTMPFGEVWDCDGCLFLYKQSDQIQVFWNFLLQQGQVEMSFSSILVQIFPNQIPFPYFSGDDVPDFIPTYPLP